MSYYKINGKEFKERTLNVDASNLYIDFELMLKTGDKILDVGFGSGRDSLYFSKKYNVVSIDNSTFFVEDSKNQLSNEVVLMDVRDINYSNEFNGIWACSSLLHIPYAELSVVFNKLLKAVVDGGIFYCSFKYGDFEGIRNGRYFTDMNEKLLSKILITLQYKSVELKITDDIRRDCNTKWLNIYIIK